MWTDRGQRPILKPHLSNQFQDDKAKNVTSISHKENCPTTLAAMFFDRSIPFANSSFHDYWANNVTSRVHVIQLTVTIFKLNSCIKETNVLTKFHENWAKNVTSRVITCFNYIHIEKNAPPTGVRAFSPIWTIFNLIRDITKPMKTAPPTGSHVFQRTRTTFELNQHIIKANILTKFHENWAKNVTLRVFTCFHYIHIEKKAPPTGGHCLQDIIGTNLLTKFHEDQTINVASRVLTNNCGRTDGLRPLS
ncbi:hypothetical protein DPMN_116099 [Dreissena polymorpha]|uniref:Uncharacterized protein n=1 Tax=Dreissena polymorpha TaxID=45954 RepID=A0A9D4KMY4_DREPO|nr:hypothetical protein DPMN_116099 [Dreissena polymorpha]